MLKTRIITALLLFVVFVFALFLLPAYAWVILASLVAALAAWEWGGLQRHGALTRGVLGGTTLTLAAILALFYPEALGLGTGYSREAGWLLGRWFYIPAAVFWLAVVPVWMRSRWTLPASFLGSVIGALIILPTWLALVQLRQMGAWALVGLMAVVWVADTGAYFCGRRFGRRKLAPAISPGKTWEGAVGGAALVLAYGLGIGLGLEIVPMPAWPLLLFGMLLFAVLSVVGDLFESLLKRQAGLKDSSAILPGHGGVLDRIDSLTSTLPLVALVWMLGWV